MTREILWASELSCEDGLRYGCFSVNEGETVGFVGLPGSGLSDCVRALMGERVFGGNLVLDGRRIAPGSPDEARRLGFHRVSRKSLWIPNLSVAENMDFRLRKRRFTLVDRKRMEENARRVIGTLALPIDPALPAERVGFAHLRMLELAIARIKGARVIVLDDISEHCSEKELGTLIRLLDSLNRDGVSLIVTGRQYSPLMAASTRVVVFRGGMSVGTLHSAALSAEAVSTLAVGFPALPLPAGRAMPGENALEVRSLNTRQALRDLSFSLAKGEIVAVMDRDNVSRHALLGALLGDDSDPATGGDVRVCGEPVCLSSPGAAIRAGFGVMLDVRRQLFLNLSVSDNLLMHAYARLGSVFVRSGLRRFVTEDAGFAYSTRERPLSDLPKSARMAVSLARWRVLRPRVMLSAAPAHTGDAAWRRRYHAFLRELTDQGSAVLLFCSNVVEAMEIADRVIVLDRGRLVHECPASMLVRDLGPKGRA